jgi:pimeloyl-ACP methyl ester carboxylesterase
MDSATPSRHARIVRGFVELSHGQVHYRKVGAGTEQFPLVMLHQSPGSSKQLEGLMRALAREGCSVVAPDTAGNGDSDALPDEVPSIEYLAENALQAIDRLVPGRFFLYGSHTGASIAMEIAIAHPDRIAGFVIDGMGLYPPDEQADIINRYAREIRPDAEATHLMKVWHFCRDQHLFWPYYNRTAEGRLPNGVPDDETFHDFVVEVLKALRTYHRSYRAAFRHPKRQRLPLINVPTLILSSPSDMLRGYTKELVSLLPYASAMDLLEWGDPRYETDAAGKIADFFKSVMMP